MLGGYFIIQSLDFPIKDENGNIIGNFNISSTSDVEIDDPIEEENFQNIPKVRYLDKKTPIQYLNDSNYPINIYFLEEEKYTYFIEIYFKYFFMFI